MFPASLLGRLPGLRPDAVQVRGGEDSARTLAEAERAQGRTSALIVAAAALVVFPAWSGFDVLLEPELAPSFLVVRLVALVPIAVATWLLCFSPVGRRRPVLLALTVIAVVQAAVIWMIPQVDAVEPYVLGLSVALYASGCVLAAHPRLTAGLVLATWLALGGAVLLAPEAPLVWALATAGFYLATASIVAIVAHVHRFGLAARELEARVRLEQEQRRTGVLLAKLQRLSQEDPLTGLANRRRWDAELETACAEARRRGSHVAVILLDLDHFKQVKDRHGHVGGDGALSQVAGLLAGRVRSDDLAARLGGDELAVLLPDATLGRAIELAERLRREASELELPGFGPGELTLSLGVAAASGDEAYPMELMAQADGQLYRAKITRNAVAAPGTPAALAVPHPAR